MTSTNPENYDPDGADLDRMTRDQLAELPGPEHAVAQVLDEWNHRSHGLISSSHGVGLFLDLLAVEGYRVTPIQEIDPSDLLPPSTD